MIVKIKQPITTCPTANDDRCTNVMLLNYDWPTCVHNVRCVCVDVRQGQLYADQRWVMRRDVVFTPNSKHVSNIALRPATHLE